MNIAQLTIGLGDGVHVTLSGTLLFSLLSIIAIGIWKVAFILSRTEHRLTVGTRTMRRHGKLIDHHGKRLNKLDGQSDPTYEDDDDDEEYYDKLR